MTPELQQAVESLSGLASGSVLEIGSLNINGGVRQFFSHCQEYIGIDIVRGNGVDLVLDAHKIGVMFGKDIFDTVIWLESAEHDNEFWTTANVIKNILKQGGKLFLSSPTIGFSYHHPPDYWRFTKDGLCRLCEMCGCKMIEMKVLKDTVGQEGLFIYGEKI